MGRSYSAGKRASSTEPSSKVRVYEREDVDGFFMSRAWVTTDSGRPREIRLPDGMTWEAAQGLADLTAAERRKAILAGRDSWGEEHGTTLGELFDAYHDAMETEWSEKHRGDKERGRDFWLTVFGKDVAVLDLNPAEAEKAVRKAIDRGTWGARAGKKRLAALRAAVLWGLNKARLYDRNPLRGLDMPDYEPETDELIYELEQVRALATPHEDVDWRLTLAVNIAYDTGRRISAILALRTEDVETDGTRVFLHFRKEYDKGRRGAHVPVSSETARLLADALEEDVVVEFGWLFPEGRLDYDDPRDKPLTLDGALWLLQEAEEALGIEHVSGRGFHGIKRRHVTESWELAGGDAGLVGDLTGNLSAELLRNVYRRSDRRRTTEQVDRVRKRLEEESEDGTD